MIEFAQTPAAERSAIFEEAGNRRGIGSHIVEKDFWVCRLLELVFADPELGGHLIFKGGIRRPHPRLIIGGRGCGNPWR